MFDIRLRMKLYKELNPNELTNSQFKKIEQEIRTPKVDSISDEYLDFKLWCDGHPSRQESFANLISRRLAKYKGAKVLEVGCGRTARLSRILSERGFKMTAMDPKLEITDNKNIEYIKGEFDYKQFNLEDYDYVIAQEPCEATEHIVRACIEQKKPFLISLCGVPHKLISGEKPKDVYDWYDFLVNIDSDNIKLRYVELDALSETPILKSNF